MKTKRGMGWFVAALAAATAPLFASTFLQACSTDRPKEAAPARVGQRIVAAGGRLTYLPAAEANALLSSRALTVEPFTAKFTVALQLPQGHLVTSGARELRFEKTAGGFRVLRNGAPVAETDRYLVPVSGDARALTGFGLPASTLVGAGARTNLTVFTAAELADEGAILSAVAPDAIAFDGVSRIGPNTYVINVASYLHKYIADNPAARAAKSAGAAITIGDNGGSGAVITSYLAIDDGARLLLLPAHVTQVGALRDADKLTMAEVFTSPEEPALLGTLRLDTATLRLDDWSRFDGYLELLPALPASPVDVFRTDFRLTSVDLPCMTEGLCPPDGGLPTTDASPSDTVDTGATDSAPPADASVDGALTTDDATFAAKAY